MTEPTVQGTHFWFASFTKNGDVISFSGTSTPTPDATRMDMFNEIVIEILTEHPEVDGAAVLAFDVQPNQL